MNFEIIIPNKENNIYNGMYISKTLLTEANKSELSFIKYILNLLPVSIELIFGSLFHCILLEPKNINKKFIIDTNYSLKKIGFRYQVSYFLVSQAIAMANSSNVKYPILEHCLKEYKVYATYIHSNIQYMVKGIVDVIDNHNNYIIDFKTTQQINNHEKIIKTINKYHYDLQYYIYSKLTGIRTMHLIFVEKYIPWNIFQYKMLPEQLEKGKQKYIKFMNKLTILLNKYNMLEIFNTDKTFFMERINHIYKNIKKQNINL